MNIPPVKISLRDGSIPSYNARVFDTPYHLRAAYDKELKIMIDAGILEPMGLRESDWCSHIFPVLKNDRAMVRVVTDIKTLK